MQQKNALFLKFVISYNVGVIFYSIWGAFKAILLLVALTSK